MVTWALAPSTVSTISVRNPDRTASVAINAKTASVIPIKLIHVIVLTPPSVRLERRYRQAIINSYFENGWGVPFTFCSFHGGFNLRRSVQMVKPPWQIFSDVL